MAVIEKAVSEDARVLDLGCGNGAFLKRLREKKNITPLGIEIAQKKIAEAVANGVPVVQGDLDSKLAFAEDKSFDFVILSRTLQEVRYPDKLLREIVRVGKRGLVSFINFGYWQCRFQLMFSGRMPKSADIPYEWYDTPNIHLGSIKDFRDLCGKLGIRIVNQTALSNRNDKIIRFAANIRASGCVFELEEAK